jgi:UDP-N-acetylglucosamine 4,6-dehydratase/UDP-glucose 4-epimerase|tara:strand:+ start:1889 stop:2752 length:864 start_codon:yes stop_codon:yes gene_type:complete
MIQIEKNKLYLVTGGGGFLGKPLVAHILNEGARVRIIGRDEGTLIMMKELHPSIEIHPGDISDSFEVKQAMQGVNGVFHLAASKHVGLAETFVRENIKSNVMGSLNIYEQSLKQELDFVLAISTDKAAQVVGVYGATKLLMERLSKQYEKLNPNCKYRIVRYGNVLYSTGSVLCKWKDLIEGGKELIVTEPEATRFFWTVEQAIDLILDCMENATDSTPYCPSMKSMSIKSLLGAMVEKYGNSNWETYPIKIIGLQPGENLHEKVLDEGPLSNEVEQFTINEIKELI